jgi:glycosyltransferase involved in cell wall biosynthesis
MARLGVSESTGPPRVLFLGSTYAGHRTRLANLEQHLSHDNRIWAEFRRVSGWKEGGRIERLPLLSGGSRGRIRAVLEAGSFARLPRPDVIWTSAGEVVTPYLWSQIGPLRRPLVLDLDATWDQLEEMAAPYKGRPPASGMRRDGQALRHSLLWRSVSVFTPWSNWAADGLRRHGIEDARIKVIPPGVDLDAWLPVKRSAPIDRPIRLLFVGGDFKRKGGDLLLDVMRSPLGSSFELDIVTRDDTSQAPNTRVHRFEPNEPGLRDLYSNADLFVLPSRAECFGIATIEAMASGVPVVVSDVGGARDIVDHGKSGWLIKPTSQDVAKCLAWVVASRALLPAIGLAAAAGARRKFDGKTNDSSLVELFLELEMRSRGTRP